MVVRTESLLVGSLSLTSLANEQSDRKQSCSEEGWLVKVALQMF